MRLQRRAVVAEEVLYRGRARLVATDVQNKFSHKLRASAGLGQWHRITQYQSGGLSNRFDLDTGPATTLRKLPFECQECGQKNAYAPDNSARSYF
jgi:hypothetical protein